MNQPKKSAQESDVKFPNPPSDGISSISVNGSATQQTNMLVATSWDNTVSCYEIQSNNQGNITNIVMQGQTKHDAPVLCSDISTDNVTAFSGACDGSVRMWNVTQGPAASQVIGKHDLAVKSVKFQENGTVVTASWDKTIKVWDTRQPNPAGVLQVSERIYAMDAKGGIAVATTADKQVHVFDMSAGRKVGEYVSPLTYQSRCVAIFSDNKGFAMGCIEGRIALEYFDEMHTKQQGALAAKPVGSKNFAYKCHRDGSDIFSVNAISFNNRNTYASAGSDGVISTWDKDARHRLGNLEQFKRQCPITDVKFNAMGNMLFYSMSYDWSKGAENNDPKFGNNIFVHTVQAVEVTPKDLKTLGKK